MTTPNLGLDELTASQSQPHVPLNSALRRLDALVFLTFRHMDMQAPPTAGSPDIAEGDAYWIPAAGSPAASGAWEGYEGHVAYYAGGGWEFVQPLEGWLAWDMVASALKVYTAGAWATLATV